MSDRLPGSCAHNPIEHGDWRIYLSDSPLKDEGYFYVHKEYDGDGDNRCGYAATVEAAKQEIDDRESE